MNHQLICLETCWMSGNSANPDQATFDAILSGFTLFAFAYLFQYLE